MIRSNAELAAAEPGMVECPTCHGIGRTEEAHDAPAGFCDSCSGTGKVRAPCPTCYASLGVPPHYDDEDANCPTWKMSSVPGCEDIGGCCCDPAPCPCTKTAHPGYAPASVHLDLRERAECGVSDDEMVAAGMETAPGSGLYRCPANCSDGWIGWDGPPPDLEEWLRPRCGVCKGWRGKTGSETGCEPCNGTGYLPPRVPLVEVTVGLAWRPEGDHCTVEGHTNLTTKADGRILLCCRHCHPRAYVNAFAAVSQCVADGVEFKVHEAATKGGE